MPLTRSALVQDMEKRMHPHEIYGWQMNAHRALALLRLMGQVSAAQARFLRTLMREGVTDSAKEQALPKSLYPLCDLLYLAQVMPGNRLPA